MRDELQLFVNEQYSPEKTALLKNIFSIFDDFQLSDYDEPFMDLISQFDSSDTTTIVLDFELLARNSLVVILREHGIVVNVDILTETLIEICTGIHEIQYYEDKDSIIRILETEYSDEERIGELLKLVTTLSVDQVLNNIESLDNNIFRLIEQTCANIGSSETDTVEQTKTDKDIVANVKLFKSFVGDKDLIGFKIISKGFRVNMSFDFYFRYLKYMIATINDSESIAMEYLIVLLMAKESHSNPINYFRKISDRMSDDLTFVTKVDISLNKLLSDFEKYKLKVNFQPELGKEDKFISIDVPSDLPTGNYKGIFSGYVAKFNFKDKEYSVKSIKDGIKGTVACVVTKNSNGTFEVKY